MTKAEREAIQTAFELIADGADPIDVALTEDFDCQIVAKATNALRELAEFRVMVVADERASQTEQRVTQLEYRVHSLECRQSSLT